MTFSGDLRRALDGTALPGRPVQVWSRPAGAATWSQGDTVTTDAAGHYGATVSTTTPHDFQLLYPGDGTMARLGLPDRSASDEPAPPPLRRPTVTIYLHKNKTSGSARAPG